MRLIDLDKTIFVPIVDETRGGMEYEMEMTIGEMFDRFLDGFQPEIVDAVPVEWLRDMMLEREREESRAAWIVTREWQKEQEANQ